MSSPHAGGSLLTVDPQQSGYGVPPSDALRILERVASIFHLIALEPQETLATIAARARDGIASGTVYDALLIACARRIDARTIYTYNLKHFQTVAPDLAGRIRLP